MFFFFLKLPAIARTNFRDDRSLEANNDSSERSRHVVDATSAAVDVVAQTFDYDGTSNVTNDNDDGRDDDDDDGDERDDVDVATRLRRMERRRAERHAKVNSLFERI